MSRRKEPGLPPLDLILTVDTEFSIAGAFTDPARLRSGMHGDPIKMPGAASEKNPPDADVTAEHAFPFCAEERIISGQSFGDALLDKLDRDTHLLVVEGAARDEDLSHCIKVAVFQLADHDAHSISFWTKRGHSQPA